VTAIGYTDRVLANYTGLDPKSAALDEGSKPLLCEPPDRCDLYCTDFLHSAVHLSFPTLVGALCKNKLPNVDTN